MGNPVNRNKRREWEEHFARENWIVGDDTRADLRRLARGEAREEADAFRSLYTSNKRPSIP